MFLKSVYVWLLVLIFVLFLFLASPKQCINLYFEKEYAIEPSWECKFDYIEVRDGPFCFSPIIGRFCGQQSPVYVRSSGIYLWIKFISDSELEATGFSARYNFTQGTYCEIFWFHSFPTSKTYQSVYLKPKSGVNCCMSWYFTTGTRL